MRTVAKLSLVVFFPAAAMSASFPLFALALWPVTMLFGLPVAWYVLFTLPEERAREFEILRCLATREPTP